MATTYWDYIRVEELLDLQSGLEEDESRLSDHEVLFITVHQVFELWFKLVLRELTSLRNVLARNPVPESGIARACAHLERMTRIFRSSVHHWEVIESLGTRDYLDFRDKLFPASGFQSAQLREMEILLGLQDDERIGMGADGKVLEALKDPAGSPSPSLERVERRLADTPTLLGALGDWLWRTPIRGSRPGEEGDEAAVGGFLEEYLVAFEGAGQRTAEMAIAAGAPDPAAMAERYRKELGEARAFFLCEDARQSRIRAAVLFIESYRDLPLLAWPRQLLSRLVEFEQAMVIFRQRHARMVERIIGRRIGTGGSSGVNYLDQSALSYRIFKDLWTVRTFQIRADALPPIGDPSPYDFKAAPEGTS